MTIWTMLRLTMVLASIAVPLVAGLNTWVRPALWAGALALTPPLAAALVLVVYFEWRARLRRQILAAESPDDELASAA